MKTFMYQCPRCTGASCTYIVGTSEQRLASYATYGPITCDLCGEAMFIRDVWDKTTNVMPHERTFARRNRATVRMSRTKDTATRDRVLHALGMHSIFCVGDVTPFGCAVCHDAAVADLAISQTA